MAELSSYKQRWRVKCQHCGSPEPFNVERVYNENDIPPTVTFHICCTNADCTHSKSMKMKQLTMRDLSGATQSITNGFDAWESPW